MKDAEIPVSNMLLATLRSRIRIRDRVYSGIISALLLLLIWDRYHIGVLSEKLSDTPAFLVPSLILDWIRVRPNALDDAVVIEFVDYFIEQLGNWDYENLEEKYQKILKYTSPEMAVQLKMHLRSLLPKVNLNKVSQRLRFQPARKIKRTNNDGQTIYTTEVWGNVTEFFDGKPKKPYKERITIVMRTGYIDATKAWFFEVIEIKRETEDELAEQEISRTIREGKRG